MPVRKTERRLPANRQAQDLGQAVVASDGRCALVSFVSSPVVVGRDNVYVLFVTDAGLATAAQSFEWTFTENGAVAATETTDHGEITYRPRATGTLAVAVRVLGAGNATQATLELAQDVVVTNAQLEGLITAARNQTGPTVTNPEVARELINDHNPYYQAVQLTAPESGDAFQRFVFTMLHDGAQVRTAVERKRLLDELSGVLNGGAGDFVHLSAQGIGVGAVRLVLLAMLPPSASGSPPLAWTELPEPPSPRASAEETLRQQLAALSEDVRIDLFNRLRFPKSNIHECARLLQALRDRYFAGVAFEAVLTGLSGTRAHWIVRHYREGPLLRT
jgi:hypothetical protein